METQKANENQEQKNTAPDLSSPFILKGKTLQVRINDKPIINATERKFQSEKEFQQLVKANGKVLFGLDLLRLDFEKMGKAFGTDENILSSFLIDLKDIEKPRFYILKVVFSLDNNFEHFCRMTQIFSVLK